MLGFGAYPEDVRVVVAGLVGVFDGGLGFADAAEATDGGRLSERGGLIATEQGVQAGEDLFAAGEEGVAEKRDSEEVLRRGGLGGWWRKWRLVWMADGLGLDLFEDAANASGDVQVGLIAVLPGGNRTVVAGKGFEFGEEGALPVGGAEEDGEDAGGPGLVTLHGLVHLGAVYVFRAKVVGADGPRLRRPFSLASQAHH